MKLFLTSLAADTGAVTEAAEKASAESFSWNTAWATISDFFIRFAGKLIACVIIFFVGRLIIKFIKKRLENSKKLSKADPNVRRFTITAVKVTLNIIMIVSIISVLGIPIASIVAVIGAAGAAIALALQGTLGNFASGVLLLILRPFRSGDFIEAGGYSGTVVEIGLFSTTVLTTDNRRVIIPNSSLTGATIVNYSSEKTRRVDMTVSVAYGTDIEKVKEVILDFAKTEPTVLKDPAPFVRMTDMKDSAIVFTVRLWVNNADYWKTRFDLSESIYNRFAEKGIHIPFNQLDIHVKK